MKLSRLIKKYFKSSEEVVSMVLGLIIVVVVISLVFNFVQRKKGDIAIPGSNDINLDGSDFANKDKNGTNGSYIVQKNDSLWKIAQDKYNDGFVWTKIAKANDLKDPYYLEVGQKLILPTEIGKKETITISEENKIISTGDYKVEKNDSLWTIAKRAYNDGYQWTKIWQENKSKLNNPNELEIGMILTLPKIK